MKRTITTRLGLLVAMLLTILPVSAYDFEVDGIYYEMISTADFTCRVVQGDIPYEGDIILPEEITYNSRSISVIEIGYEAFRDCSSLCSIIIPNSVIKIDEYAFRNCSALETVAIGEAVRVINKFAFSGCALLKELYLPDSVRLIDYESFSECDGLTSVTLGDGLVTIGDYAFHGCSSIENITFGNSLERIGSYAFYGCSSLNSVRLPESLKEIGVYAFCGCSNLESMILGNSVEEIKRAAFLGCRSLTSVKLPDSVTILGRSAFSNCSNLESIEIGNGLSYLEYGTFNGCENLQAISIPGNIRYLCLNSWDIKTKESDEYLFGFCNRLKELNIEYSEWELYGQHHSSNYCVGDHYLYFYYIEYVGNYWDQEGIQTWLPIERLFVDRMVYDSQVFPYLKHLVLGEHITEVQILPEECSELETLTCYASLPPICPDFTNAQYMNVIVKVPEESLEAYKAAEGWKNFWNIQGFDTSGVDEVSSAEDVYEVGRYDLNGVAVGGDYEGIVVVRYSDGSTKKLLKRK